MVPMDSPSKKVSCDDDVHVAAGTEARVLQLCGRFFVCSQATPPSHD